MSGKLKYFLAQNILLWTGRDEFVLPEVINLEESITTLLLPRYQSHAKQDTCILLSKERTAFSLPFTKVL